jgi:anthranilate synthase component 2
VILLVDNYDSFTYNLAHLFGGLGAEVIVRRNDAIDAAGAVRLAPAQLVISPGPGRPADAGGGGPAARVPTLGVCLGHQAVVEAFGGGSTAHNGYCTARRASSSTTARACSAACRRGSRSGATTRSPRRVCPTCSRCGASDDGEVMGVRHRELPIEGVQFHPESVRTPLGKDLLRNFIS